MATASYRINNNTGNSSVVLENADGLAVTIGNTVNITLTDAGYQSAISIFGVNNVLLLTATAAAANSPYTYTPLGLETISVTSSSAVALNPPTGATTVQIAVSGAAVNYRDDGTAPTSSVGMPAAVGAEFFLSQANLANIQFIAQTGTATLTLSFYK